MPDININVDINVNIFSIPIIKHRLAQEKCTKQNIINYIVYVIDIF